MSTYFRKFQRSINNWITDKVIGVNDIELERRASESDTMFQSNRYARLHSDTNASTNSTRRRRRRTHWMSIPLADPPPNKGVQPPIPEKERGSMHVIDQTFESLDYDSCQNYLSIEEQRNMSKLSRFKLSLFRGLISIVTGFLTASVAIFIDVIIHYVSKIKFNVISKYFRNDFSRAVPLLVWWSFNIAFVSVAALLGSFIEPVSAGSGIPQVKCYLNGVKYPRVVRIKTLLCKGLGVTFSVLGGLLVGKEGPMIHSGAVIAAGISQGKSSTFNKDLGFFTKFREDHVKRDFVASGAAAGVASAFGAPIGGVLFALEEGASYWRQTLTWNSFLAAGVAVLTLNSALSLIYGREYGGLLNFGEFENLTVSLADYSVFFIMAIIGGFFGALFNYINKCLTVMRMRYINTPWRKLFEVLAVASVTTIVAFTIIIGFPDCKEPPKDRPSQYPVNSMCPTGMESMSARLFMATPEESVVNLFHDPYGTYGTSSLFVHFITTYLLSCYTYGLGVPAGLFIPTLLTGASFGRLFGVSVTSYIPMLTASNPENEGKYALVGAALFLGAVVRMTLSLTSIMVECIGEITFTVPFFFVIYIAKYIGDIFNQGLYDIHIRICGVPFLEWECEPYLENLQARKIMNKNLVSLRPVESVRRLLLIARNTTHNGFPVVWDDNINVDCFEADPKKDGEESGEGGDNDTNADPIASEVVGDSKELPGENSKEGASIEASKKDNTTIEISEDHIAVKEEILRRRRSNTTSEAGEEYVEESIDMMFDVNPFVLKDYYAQSKNQTDVLNSHLLTDSCIHRFDKPATSRVSSTNVIDSILSEEDEEEVEETPPNPPPTEGASSSRWHDQPSPDQEIDEARMKSELLNVSGTLCGLMLRSQIMVLLKHKMFIEDNRDNRTSYESLKIFRDAYPRFYDLEAVDLRPEDLDCHVDMRKYMNPAPYTVTERMNMPRVFSMFRSAGLRHLLVVDSNYRPQGVITRKDITAIHAHKKNGNITIERMNVHEKV